MAVCWEVLGTGASYSVLCPMPMSSLVLASKLGSESPLPSLRHLRTTRKTRLGRSVHFRSTLLRGSRSGSVLLRPSGQPPKRRTTMTTTSMSGRGLPPPAPRPLRRIAMTTTFVPPRSPWNLLLGSRWGSGSLRPSLPLPRTRMGSLVLHSWRTSTTPRAARRIVLPQHPPQHPSRQRPAAWNSAMRASVTAVVATKSRTTIDTVLKFGSRAMNLLLRHSCRCWKRRRAVLSVPK
mmetsp:Transcript_10266/g.27854  ORF Transcript_10266/g.27854 Transcript_10266/m.27854 type:complete len:235 (+) Transcript_10266:73-777(+)